MLFLHPCSSPLQPKELLGFLAACQVVSLKTSFQFDLLTSVERLSCRGGTQPRHRQVDDDKPRVPLASNELSSTRR
jgi:hypothetical protein